MRLIQTIPLTILATALSLTTAARLVAQEVSRVTVTSPTQPLEVGEKARVSATAYDANGEVVKVSFLYFSLDGGRELSINSTTGEIVAYKGGRYEVIARALDPSRISATITVTVAFPPLDRIEISEDGGRYYVGVTLRHKATVIDQADDTRDVPVAWSTSDASVAAVDRFGVFSAHAPGAVTLSAVAEGVAGEITYQVADNPVTSMAVEASQTRGRTGDVIHFSATPTGAGGTDRPVAPMRGSGP